MTATTTPAWLSRAAPPAIMGIVNLNDDSFSGDGTLDPGETDTTRDAGMVPLALATVGDLVWADYDEDGIQDGAEPGMPTIS